MQITSTWTCRECEYDQEDLTDTSGFGFLSPSETLVQSSVTDHPLKRRACGHVSGILGLAYRFEEAHRPKRERERRAQDEEWRKRRRRANSRRNVFSALRRLVWR